MGQLLTKLSNWNKRRRSRRSLVARGRIKIYEDFKRSIGRYFKWRKLAKKLPIEISAWKELDDTRNFTFTFEPVYWRALKLKICLGKDDTVKDVLAVVRRALSKHYKHALIKTKGSVYSTFVEFTYDTKPWSPCLELEIHMNSDGRCKVTKKTRTQTIIDYEVQCDEKNNHPVQLPRTLR
jgi:hypothetical protein